jgi:hypothetical protein
VFLPSVDLKPRHIRGFLSFAPPALGECSHGVLAGRRVAVREHVILTILNDEDCTHPRRADRRGIGLEDAADNFAIRQHAEIVVILAGRTRGRSALSP